MLAPQGAHRRGGASLQGAAQGPHLLVPGECVGSQSCQDISRPQQVQRQWPGRGKCGTGGGQSGDDG